MPDPVSHFEIGVRDVNTAIDFYSKLFGWEFSIELEGYGVSGIGNAPEGLGLYPMDEGMQPWVTAYLKIENIEETLEKAVQAGGTILRERTLIDDVHGWYAWFADPEGNKIGIWEPNK